MYSKLNQMKNSNLHNITKMLKYRIKQQMPKIFKLWNFQINKFGKKVLKDSTELLVSNKTSYNQNKSL